MFKKHPRKKLLCVLLSLAVLFLFIPLANYAQKVTIKNIAGPKKGSCGEFQWQVQFNLSANAPAAGFIVQRINYAINVYNCANAPIQRVNTMFWEAWSVAAGQTGCKPIAADGTNDYFMNPARPNTYGDLTVTGKAAFFAMAALPPTFAVGNVPMAGILPSYNDNNQHPPAPPPFWTAAAEANATDHNISSVWNCCNGQDTTRVVTVPKYTVTTMASVYNNCTNTLPVAKLVINNIPSWLKGYGPVEQNLFNNVIAQISTYPDRDIREAIACITQKSNLSGIEYFEHNAKIYIMLRALYQVPSSPVSLPAKIFGGWQRDINEPKGTYNYMWPLQYNTNGQLNVTGKFTGYSGASYDAVAEFDYFSTNYSRRIVGADNDLPPVKQNN